MAEKLEERSRDGLSEANGRMASSTWSFLLQRLARKMRETLVDIIEKP